MSFRAGLAVSAASAAAGFPLAPSTRLASSTRLVPAVPTASHPVQAAGTKLR